MNDPEHGRVLGMAAFLLLSAGVVSGTALAGRLAAPRSRGRLFVWHRRLSIAGLSIAALHAASGVAEIAAGEFAVAPWVGGGFVALAAGTLPPVAWGMRRAHRRLSVPLHGAAYAAFGVALVHGLASHAGGEMHGPEAALYGGVTLVVAATLGARLRGWTCDAEREAGTAS